MKKRTEVTIEIEREIVITKLANNRSWCSVCGKQVQMLTAGETAQMMQASESVVHQLAESGQLHFAASHEGMLLICPNSLPALRNRENMRSTQRLLITEGEVSAD